MQRQSVLSRVVCFRGGPVPAGGAAHVRMHVGHAEDLREAGSRSERRDRNLGCRTGENMGGPHVSFRRQIVCELATGVVFF